MITLSKRQWILGSGLTATLAAVAYVSFSGDPVDDSAQPTAAKRGAGGAVPVADRGRASAAPDGSGVEPSRLIRLIASRKVGDPFQAQTFQPAPPPARPAITVAAPVDVAPVAPPEPPASPKAPAFPWTFMGRMIEDPTNPSVFLSRSDRLTVVHIGDTLENVWKVQGMDARSLRVEYLPLKSGVNVSLVAASDVSSAAASGTSNGNNFGQAGLNNFNAPSRPELRVDEVAVPPAAAPVATATPPTPAGVSGIETSNGIGEIR